MLKVLHLISGGDTGGAKTHVLSLVSGLQCKVYTKIICFMEGSFYDEAKERGINIKVLNQKSRFDLKVVDEIINTIKDEKFDIVHSHGARANFITSFVKRKIDIPCITTMHSDYLHDFKGNIYKHIVFTALNKMALKKLDYYIAISDDFKQMLVRRRFKEKKILIAYNGLDFNSDISAEPREMFLKEHNLSSINDSILVGIIARLHQVKGHKVLLDAAAKVLKKHKAVHFMLAGDGEERQNLEKYAEAKGISDNIHFLGYLDNIYGFINTIDINVLTSYTESFPYALLEGARMSKPSIASAVGGIPKLIIDRETGFLFESGNSSQLAEKLDRMLNNPDMRNQLGNKLYEHAKTNYSVESLADRHMEIYKTILGEE